METFELASSRLGRKWTEKQDQESSLLLIRSSWMLKGEIWIEGQSSRTVPEPGSGPTELLTDSKKVCLGNVLVELQRWDRDKSVIE
jgi:hypothetical protein